MSKLSHVTLRLLGAFAVEANVGRPIPIVIRPKKARALLAYLAMQRDYRARREELATLLWGDNPDALARQSLRQCLISLRQDLCAASDMLVVEREAIALRSQIVTVDARSLAALARSAAPDALAAAAALWQGPFLADLALDVDEFDAWRNEETERLAAAAAGIFAALARNADANGQGDRAIAAAEQLVALEPTREDRQRTLLKLVVRYRGRETALSRAKLLTGLLHRELDVAPEAATRALIEEIRRGDFAPGPAPRPPEAAPVSRSVQGTNALAITAPPRLAAPALRDQTAAKLPFWRRRLLAAAGAAMAVLLIGISAVVAPLSRSKMTARRTPAIVVLPFADDKDGQPGDPQFAQTLTHDLVGYLSRFGNMRVISEQTTDFYRLRQLDVTQLTTDAGAQYAIAGHVQRNDSALRIDLQLVDTASRTNVWSDHVQRERGEPTLLADESARGMARMIAIEIDRLGALHVRGKPASQLAIQDLVARGNLALLRGAMRENLSDAMASFNEALQRNPHYQPALLAVARVRIVALTNFVDFGPLPDLGEIERFLNDILRKAPNSISALYSLALLQKHHRQYPASLRSLQRCLEINPSFLPAQGQIGDIFTRMGQPQQGLEQIQKTIRMASPNDPSMGYWYLFAAEAELELGHGEAALDWALRANTFMPGSPLVQVWLASIYATVGDKSNAAKYVGVLAQIAPDRMRLFMKRPIGDSANREPRPRIIDGLRLALGSG
ncbi:MAG TPA: BTAD domain-containing putative transcriptional regulator [Xanthobacteraceae bacterium]|jgi:DNA-binding SARP family transcriptional activator/TolB-like protein